MIFYKIDLIFLDHSFIVFYYSPFECSYAFLFDHYYNLYPDLLDIKIIKVGKIQVEVLP